MDGGFRLRGLITVKDIQKQIRYPLACKDRFGRLRVGAALGIAKNTLNNSIRRSKVEGQRLDSLSPEVVRPPSTLFDCNPEEHLNMRRYTEAIRDRLESVSPWQTEIFAMRHLENMSIQEIAERTHRSSDAIRSSLYRVKRLLFETADLSQASISSSSPPPFRPPEQLHRG